MKIAPCTLVSLLVCVVVKAEKTLGNSTSADQQRGRCVDPMQAVLDLFECVANSDAACAAASYAPSFQKFHNEIYTGDIPVKNPAFWQGSFINFPTFEFEIKFSKNVGKNMADVRYIEQVTSTDGTNLGLAGAPFSTYPFGQTVFQHEHALVEVDNSCRLVKWDQYGDNTEQSHVSAITVALLCAVIPSASGCTPP